MDPSSQYTVLQKVITIPTSDPYPQDSPYERKDSLLQSEGNIDEQYSEFLALAASQTHSNNALIKPRHTTLSADSAITEDDYLTQIYKSNSNIKEAQLTSFIEETPYISKEVFKSRPINKSGKQKHSQGLPNNIDSWQLKEKLEKFKMPINSKTPKKGKQSINNSLRETEQSKRQNEILNQSSVVKGSTLNFDETEFSAYKKASANNQTLSLAPIQETRSSFSKFPLIAGTSLGDKSTTNSKRQGALQSSLQSITFNQSSLAGESVLPKALVAPYNQYSSVAAEGKSSVNQRDSTTMIGLKGQSALDIRLKQSSKSVLKNYDRGLRGGLQFLHPLSNNPNDEIVGESRNETLKNNASNQMSNQLSDHIKTLKAQSKQERYKSVEQKPHEFAHMKFPNQSSTFDYEREGEVFYSIQQSNAYDNMGANLKVLPNKIAVDSSANFVSKKRQGSQDKLGTKSMVRSQLRSLVDQQHLKGILNQSAITPQRDHSIIHDFLQGSEATGIQSRSQLGLSKNYHQKDQKASLRDLMADPSSFGVVSQSQLSSKIPPDIYSNPLLNQQYFMEMSHIPSQSNLQSLANLHSLKALRDASLKSIKVISKRELAKVEEQVDLLEMEIKERMRPTDKNKLNYENHNAFILHHYQCYQNIFDGFCSKLSSKHLFKEKELLSRLLRGFTIQFMGLSSLAETQLKLQQTAIQELEKEILKGREEFERFKKTQSIEAYFLKQMGELDETESVEEGLKKKRALFVQSIDDYLQGDTLSKTWEQGEEERDKNMDRSKFSGVSQSLKDIRHSMKGYKDLSKLLDMMGIDQENEQNKLEGNVFQREKVVKEIESDFNTQIKDVQKTTAKKILARFLKQTQTATVGTQAHSMEELTYDLQRQLEELKDRSDSLRFEKIQLQIKVDKLQDQLNTVTEQKRQVEKTLTQSCDLMQVEVQQSRLEKAKMVEDMAKLREFIGEKEDLIRDLERKCEDKDFIQSRLNSLRNKYEEYDQVHGDTHRQMNNFENQSLQFNEVSEDGKSARSSSNTIGSRAFKFQGKLITKPMNPADSRQSKNLENSQYNQSSSRGNLLSSQNQFKGNSALLKTGTGIGGLSGLGGGYYKRNSNISDSQAESIRDGGEAAQQSESYFAPQSPRQRNKTVAASKQILSQENLKGSQQRLDEDLSRPISLGNSPRMNDLKVTITSQDSKIKPKEGYQSNASQQMLSQQASEPAQLSKLGGANSSQIQSKASGLKLNAKSNSTAAIALSQKNAQMQSIGNNNDIMHAANPQFGKKAQRVEASLKNKNEKGQSITREYSQGNLNSSLLKQNSTSKFKKIHEKNNQQNSNRFKNNGNPGGEDYEETINNAMQRSQEDLEQVMTLEIDQNQQYVVEDEDYGADDAEQEYLHNNRNEVEIQKSKQVLTENVTRSLRKSIQRIGEFESAALRRVSYLQRNQGEIQLETKEFQSSISPTQVQYIKKSKNQMQMLIDSNRQGDTLRLQQPPHLASNVSPQQLLLQSKGNGIQQSEAAGHYYQFIRSQAQIDPKYNTSELLMSNMAMAQDGLNPMLVFEEGDGIRRESQQFSTIQQFPKIRSQVSIVTRKSKKGVPSFSEDDLQTYYNKLSQNRSSDFIKEGITPSKGAQFKNMSKEQLMQALIQSQQLTHTSSAFQNTAIATKTRNLAVGQDNSQQQRQLRNVRTLEVQTDNDTFLTELVALFQQIIVSAIKEERFKYSDKEYELLLKRVSQLAQRLRDKVTRVKDEILIQSGKYLESKNFKKAYLELLTSPSKGIFAKDEERKQVAKAVGSRSLSPMNQYEMKNVQAQSSLRQQEQSNFRVEEHFKVKLQRRPGGAGDFLRYGENNQRLLRKDRSQDLKGTGLQRLQH